jgi:hypothetical protein
MTKRLSKIDNRGNVLPGIYLPVFEFQEELKSRGLIITESMDFHKSLIVSNDINESKNILYNLVKEGFIKVRFIDLFDIRPIFYLKRIKIPGNHEWETTFQFSSDELKNGTIKEKITGEYHLLKTKSDCHNSIIIELEKQDIAVFFKDKYSNIPPIINNLNPTKTQNKSMKRFKIEKPTSTFWLCFSIILVGLLFCGTYYFVNKDNGRYEYQSGLVIDKKTGDAKPIKIKRE